MLDTRYTKELADAKANINQLERDVAAGKREAQRNMPHEWSDRHRRDGQCFSPLT
ncbi:lysis system i-spanin subunit Rz [Enterobacter sp.]|uniref:lysis system i-spanin subunit Rz n=1 Tax=Enterobacter sp. TaxID=42895 RepID=UPI00296F982B|nr:lysis system i-spanin subunit Rz [Enterobacter sp.]